MTVQPVNNIQPKRANYKYNSVKWTGYGAVGLTAISVLQASRHKMKSHKVFAWLSILSALCHIGIIEYFHHKK